VFKDLSNACTPALFQSVSKTTCGSVTASLGVVKSAFSISFGLVGSFSPQINGMAAVQCSAVSMGIKIINFLIIIHFLKKISIFGVGLKFLFTSDYKISSFPLELGVISYCFDRR